MMVVSAVIFLPGCFLWPKPRYVIAEMPTAQEQFAIAFDAYRVASGYYGQSDQKDEATGEAEAALRMVVKRFPEDEEYRPQAQILLARCMLLLREDYKKAAEYYRTALDDNPNVPLVQQVGLYELGLALDGAGKYSEAKNIYQSYIDRYSDDPDLKDDREAQRRLFEAQKRLRIIRKGP